MPEPSEVEPKDEWPHHELYKRVKDALFALPSHFKSDISIRGLDAEDLFSMGGVLAAAIEQNVVDTLNGMRTVWDPNSQYSNCSFVRQAQTFPDVLFVQHSDGGSQKPIMGVELKGWYLLSKEGEPSFRYKITPDACAPQDLLVVFCWALDDVLSGTPEIYEPYVTSAKRASHYVDYYWTEKRNTSQSTEIERPDDVTPYPRAKSKKIHDVPVKDGGNNYGRVARTGMMDEYVSRMISKTIAGIPADEWIRFLKKGYGNEDQGRFNF